MLNHLSGRLAGVSRRTLVMAVMALMVPVTALASASPAMAEPKGIFKVFKECPTEIPGLAQCTFSQVTAGEFVIGTSRVPITGSGQTITLQGGNIKTGNPENEAEYFALPAKNGESLSKTELNVPGGLTGFINCEEIKGSGWFETELRKACKAVFEGPLLGVTATSELVANEHNPVIVNEFNANREEGTALTLPLRVHLKNPFLGKSCYIGSEAHPLQLHLTTGATSLKSPPKGWKSIHGALGEIRGESEKELSVLRLIGNSLVDNTFAAPAPEGCGEITLFGKTYTGFADSLLEGKLKIPNNPGENTAILTGEQKLTEPSSVIASESF
jgi:hypothetical protein